VIARVRALFRTPRRELPRAIAEPGDVRSLLRYVLPLVAIGGVARFVSEGLIGVYSAPAAELFGMSIGGGMKREPIPALVDALAWCALGLGAWYALARVLAWLAPRMHGRHDADAARKLSAIALTPLWLAGGAALLSSVPYLSLIEPLADVAGLAYGMLLGIWALPFLLATPEADAPAHMLAAAGLALTPFAGAWSLVVALTHG
jgi:hypothetical protein